MARLEDQGQLERRPHPRHRNVQELYLTDSGYAALQAADDEIAAIEQQITRRLAPADTVQLTALLARVADAARST